MGHQHWEVHISKNVPRDAAEDDFAKARMAVRTHDQKIGIEL
jgi:hypothetical protein